MSENTPNLDARGIGYAYYLAMQKYKERIAQVDVTTNEQQSYEELLQRSISAAIAIEKAELKPGDFISICSINYFDVSVVYFASLFTGVITAAVDSTMTAQEIVYLLNQTKPKIIFVGPNSVGLVEEVVANLEFELSIVVLGDSRSHTSFSQFLGHSSSNEEFKPRIPSNLDETTVVHFSSGTTGRPKGICISHKAMLSYNRVFEGYLTIAWFSSIYWSVFNVFSHIFVLNGMKRLVFPPFDRDNPWAILKFKIDYMFTNTLQALTFLNHPMPNDVDIENLGLYSISGHHMSKEQALELYMLFPKTSIMNTYGMTEVFGIVSAFPPHRTELRYKYPNSVGTPTNIQWKIVDFETDQVLGPNQQGELRLKTDRLCKGYYNLDSSEMFDSDGWLKTGDLVYYNDEMCFFVVDRIKESFKYQAYHIIPREIEDVLLTHPSVAEAVVIGRPHKTEGNHPTAIIKLKKNKTVSEEEVLKFVEERVSDKNRLRGGVKILDNILLTATGKFNRFQLKQKLLKDEL